MPGCEGQTLEEATCPALLQTAEEKAAQRRARQSMKTSSLHTSYFILYSMKRLLATSSRGEGADVTDAVGSATRKEKQVGGKLKGTTGG